MSLGQDSDVIYKGQNNMTATDLIPISVVVDQKHNLHDRCVLSALRTQMPPGSYEIVESLDRTCNGRAVQFLDPAYVTAAFDWVQVSSSGSLVNMYPYCDALNQKHHLALTVQMWISKHPDSLLKTNVVPSDAFELDYADFLDQALDEYEAFDLKASLAQNESKAPELRDWWILKPSFCDQRDGVRLFTSQDGLRAIFQEWEKDCDDGGNQATTTAYHAQLTASTLRSFVAQPYIHPPFTLDGLKFGIRTHVVAAGNLRVFVARDMYVRCAAKPYVSPWKDDLPDLDRHLASTRQAQQLFWDIDDAKISNVQKECIFKEICIMTRDVFMAAASQRAAFFPTFPGAFEIFGLDFLVDTNMKTWLLEVNSGPSINPVAGAEWPVQQLYNNIVDFIVKPYFGLTSKVESTDSFVQVLMQDDKPGEFGLVQRTL